MKLLSKNKKLPIVLGIVFLVLFYLILKNTFFGGTIRDIKRKSDLAEIAWVLEKYYADNHQYPKSSVLSPYVSNSKDDVWIPGLEPYLEKMPKDPVNKGEGDVYANRKKDYTYVYISDTIEDTQVRAGHYYILAARLENRNDPDNLDNKRSFWPGCNLGIGFSSSYYLLTSYKCKVIVSSQERRFDLVKLLSIAGPVLFIICFSFLALFFISKVFKKKGKEASIKRDERRKKDLLEIQKELEVYYNYHKRYPIAQGNEIRNMMKVKDPLAGQSSKFKDKLYGYYYDNLKFPHGEEDTSDTQYYRLRCLLENPDDPDIDHYFDGEFHWVYLLTSQKNSEGP